MGIKLDPPYGYCIDNTCFPAGETPCKLYLSLSEIKVSPLFVPGYPAPPNGTFTLTQNTATQWLGQTEYWRFAFDTGFGGSIVQAVNIAVQYGFLSALVADCTFEFTSILDPAVHYYYEGSAGIFKAPPGSLNSGANAAELLNIRTDKGTFWHPEHPATGKFVHRFARFEGGTNIKILLEP